MTILTTTRKPLALSITRLFCGTLLLVFSLPAFAQKSNCYKIDTAKILLNNSLDAFLTKIKTTPLAVCTNKDSIPQSIKRELDCLTKGFTLANPGEDFQCCCISSDSLPRRQLFFMAKSNDLLIMTYKTGGMGTTTHILFIQYTNGHITDLWTGVCLKDLKSKKAIIKYINKNRHVKWGLNTNLVYL